MKKITIVTTILLLIGLVAFFVIQERLKEKSYIYSFQKESISFVKPKNFLITDHSEAFSQVWLYVSPPSFNLNCFNSYEPLVEIQSVGSNSITFATSSDMFMKKNTGWYIQKDDIQYGNTVFKHFFREPSDNYYHDKYILFGTTTMLEITYNPKGCPWRDYSYDNQLSKILSTLNFKEDETRPVHIDTEEDKINKIKKVLQEYYDNGRYKDSDVCPSYSAVSDVEIKALRMKTCLEFFKNK